MSRPATNTIFIGNLPYDLTEASLADVFTPVGAVKSSRLVIDRASGKFKGYGFVEFYDVETAMSALRNMTGHDVHGRSIRIDYAEEGQGGGGPGQRRGPHDGHGGRPHDRRDGPQANASRPGSQPLGPAASVAAQSAMGTLLRDPHAPPSASADMISATLGSLSRQQLYDIMRQVKHTIQADPQQTRELLVKQPQLTKALLQAQIMLGMVEVPGHPLPPQTDAGALPPPQGMAPRMDAGMGQASGGVPGPQPHPHPQQHHMGQGYGLPGPQMQPPQQMAQPQMARPQYAPPVKQEVPPAGAPSAGMSAHNAALLQQVLHLTQDQIDMLPADQRQIVMRLKEAAPGVK